MSVALLIVELVVIAVGLMHVALEWDRVRAAARRLRQSRRRAPQAVMTVSFPPRGEIRLPSSERWHVGRSTHDESLTADRVSRWGAVGRSAHDLSLSVDHASR